MRGALFWVGVLGLLSTGAAAQPAPPRAPEESRAQARAYFEEGIRNFNVGDFARALEAFKQGYLVKPDPAFLFNIGQCHRMMKNFEDAAHAYRAYLREQPTAPNHAEVEKFITTAEAEIQRRAATVPLGPPATLGATTGQLPPRVAPVERATTAVVVVESAPSGAEVRIDDASAPSVGATPLRLEKVEAGPHILYLKLAGHLPATKAFTAGAGESVRLDLSLVTEEAERPATVEEKPRSRGWIAGVVIGALLVVGAGAAGGVYLAKHPGATMLPTVGTP